MTQYTKRADHARKCRAQHRGEKVVDKHGPGHALLTLDGGEYLRTVHERNRALAHRVEHGEDIEEPPWMAGQRPWFLNLFIRYLTYTAARAVRFCGSSMIKASPVARRNMAISGKV
jgi:hypothetical protein